jgi:hypothetical protein
MDRMTFLLLCSDNGCFSSQPWYFANWRRGFQEGFVQGWNLETWDIATYHDLTLVALVCVRSVVGLTC